MSKRYSELILLPTFEERFKYCSDLSRVGEETFGGHRYLNQRFYSSPEWKRIRRQIIIRDNGCDLAVPGYDIHGSIFIHHLNSMKIEDLMLHKDWVLLPEYLVCCSYDTHQALHYSKEYNAPGVFVKRQPNDTAPWLNRSESDGQYIDYNQEDARD